MYFLFAVFIQIYVPPSPLVLSKNVPPLILLWPLHQGGTVIPLPVPLAPCGKPWVIKRYMLIAHVLILEN